MKFNAIFSLLTFEIKKKKKKAIEICAKEIKNVMDNYLGLYIVKM